MVKYFNVQFALKDGKREGNETFGIRFLDIYDSKESALNAIKKINQDYFQVETLNINQWHGLPDYTTVVDIDPEEARKVLNIPKSKTHLDVGDDNIDYLDMMKSRKELLENASNQQKLALDEIRKKIYIDRPELPKEKVELFSHAIEQLKIILDDYDFNLKCFTDNLEHIKNAPDKEPEYDYTLVEKDGYYLEYSNKEFKNNGKSVLISFADTKGTAQTNHKFVFKVYAIDKDKKLAVKIKELSENCKYDIAKIPTNVWIPINFNTNEAQSMHDLNNIIGNIIEKEECKKKILERRKKGEEIPIVFTKDFYRKDNDKIIEEIKEMRDKYKEIIEFVKKSYEIVEKDNIPQELYDKYEKLMERIKDDKYNKLTR